MTKPYHITQEQALEIAKRLSVVSDEGFIDSDYLEEIINAALDKVLGEQWISVKDRLPDYDVLVNVYVDRSQRSLHNKVRSDYRNQMSEVKRDMWMQTRGDEKITHWMPLPLPPLYPQPTKNEPNEEG